MEGENEGAKWDVIKKIYELKEEERGKLIKGENTLMVEKETKTLRKHKQNPMRSMKNRKPNGETVREKR